MTVSPATVKSMTCKSGLVEQAVCTASGKEPLAARGENEDTSGANPNRRARHLDSLGLVWSALCALHCTVPLLLAGTALLNSAHHVHAHGGHSDLQLLLAAASVAVAGALLARSYLLQHRDPRPLWILAGAVILLALGRLLPLSSEFAGIALVSGGFLTLIAAQVSNVLLVRRLGATCCDRALRAEEPTT